jgi:uncharacterized protein DUF5655
LKPTSSRRARRPIPLRERPLWRCPECGHEFVGRNMSHSCGVYDLDAHFADKPPEVRRLFDALVASLREFGPFKVEAQKTRIVFQVRVRFAGAVPLKSGLRGHFWLTRAAPGPPVTRVEALLPNCYVHTFLLRRPSDLNASLRARLRRAYAVGKQEHL